MENYNVIMKPIPWKRGLNYLEHGEAFALFSPFYYPKIRPFIFPYSEYLLKETTAIVCNKDVSMHNRKTWPEDYYGLLIGINRGYSIGGKQFHKALAEGNIKIREIEGTPKNLLTLAAGRTDCYINDINAIKWNIAQFKRQPQYKNLVSELQFGPVISFEYSYLGYSRHHSKSKPFKKNFVAQFDSIIKEMKISGQVDDIVANFYKEQPIKPVSIELLDEVKPLDGSTY